MSQVKWVDANSLKDNAGKCDCDVGSTGPVPVVPLSALREVVEGLKYIEAVLCERKLCGHFTAEEMTFSTAQRETIRRLEGERDAAQFMAKRAMDELTKAQARLTASEAKGKWTSARPTVAGWYWWRFSVSTIPIIRCLQWDDDVQEFYDDVGTENKTLNELGGEWQGPLTPGEE